jgi:hypothetical protein
MTAAMYFGIRYVFSRTDADDSLAGLLITATGDALGVPGGFYAFRSWGREMVHAMPIKGLRQGLSALAIERIGRIAAGCYQSVRANGVVGTQDRI